MIEKHKLLSNVLHGCLILLLAGVTYAATLTGTVTNGTTNKPSAGDEVILIKLGAGMEEAAHTKTDSHGKYSFALPDDGMHLVRVIHQGVTYHQPAPPGTNSIEVQVYDASAKVQGVNAVADLMYIQAGKGDLAIMRLFAVDNSSQPPRTQMNDANFEFYAPENAEIEEAQAQTAGGQWVNTQPVPQKEKGRYAFVFPIRPGQTQFRVTYHLPYSGKAAVDPKLIYPLQHFVTIMPRSLGFTPSSTGVYQDKQPPDLPDAIAEVASNPKPGQNLAFEISGEGSLQDQSQNASNDGGPSQSGSSQNESPQSQSSQSQSSQSQSSGAPAGSANNLPGGGLGTPGNDPDPMDQYRWWFLGGFAVVLAGGAVYISSRSKAPLATTGPAAPTGSSPASGPSSATLLDALKEELFQLELEHQRGQISDQEYASAKAALDQTLSRALKRTK